MTARRHTERVFVVVVTERGTPDAPAITHVFTTERAAEAWGARWADGAYRVSMARYERAPWPRSRSQKRGR